jgi:hypothetical protein
MILSRYFRCFPSFPKERKEENTQRYPPRYGSYKELLEACSEDNVEYVIIYKMHNPQMTTELWTYALQKACDAGSKDVVTYMVRRMGICPSQECMQVICQKGHETLYPILLSHPGYTPCCVDIENYIRLWTYLAKRSVLHSLFYRLDERGKNMVRGMSLWNSYMKWVYIDLVWIMGYKCGLPLDICRRFIIYFIVY